MAKVTYVMPTIRKRWVKETIDSVLHQTMEDWEMIIIDKNRTVINHPDKRIKVLNWDTQPHNTGLNEARDIATSDIILHIHDDDLDLAHRADYIYNKMQDESIDVFVGSYVEMTEDRRLMKKVPIYPWDYEKFLLYGLNMPLFCAGYRNSTCPPWRKDFSLLADYCFYTDCHKQGLNIVTDDEVLAHIRVHPDQASKTDCIKEMKIYWDMERWRYCQLYGVERINR